MRSLSAAALCLSLAALPAAADDVTTALTNALGAWQAGDAARAMTETGFAMQALQSFRTGQLAAFLPEAPDGMTRTLSEDAGAALGMMGGGVMAQARYEGGGADFTLTLTADNPMLAGFVSMFANPMLLAQMGKVIRLGDVAVLDNGTELTAVVDQRILVQVSGAEAAVAMPVLERIDLAGLAGFGR